MPGTEMTKIKPMLICEIVLTNEQLKAVGCLAIESTRLETHIELALMDHFGTELGKFLCEGRMLGSKVDLFKAVFAREVLDEQHAKDLRRLHEDMKGGIAKRNAVIHGSWEEKMSLADLARLNDPDRNATVYKKAMKINASEVMALAHRFAEYQMRIVDWYMPVQEKYVAMHGE
jgi:hypothetical protein